MHTQKIKQENERLEYPVLRSKPLRWIRKPFAVWVSTAEKIIPGESLKFSRKFGGGSQRQLCMKTRPLCLAPGGGTLWSCASSSSHPSGRPSVNECQGANPTSGAKKQKGSPKGPETPKRSKVGQKRVGGLNQARKIRERLRGRT